MKNAKQTMQSPVGAWYSSITFPDGTVQRSLVQYSQEGNVAETSTRFPARFLGIGLWKQTENRTFEAFFEKFLFAKGEETPKVWVRVAYTVTLDETGNEYVGEAKGIFMTMEREVINTLPTRVEATRMGWSL